MDKFLLRLRTQVRLTKASLVPKSCVKKSADLILQNNPNTYFFRIWKKGKETVYKLNPESTSEESQVRSS